MRATKTLFIGVVLTLLMGCGVWLNPHFVETAEQCKQYFSWGVRATVGCFRCARHYWDQVDTCMGCGKSCVGHYSDQVDTCMGYGKSCVERVCEGGPSRECAHSEHMTACHRSCMAETYLNGRNFSLSPSVAVDRFEARAARTCGSTCVERVCEGGPSRECVYSEEMTTCHRSCMATTADPYRLNGHYFSFKTGGSPADVVDRFEARTTPGEFEVTFYRSGPVGSTGRVDSASAAPMESYTVELHTMRGTELRGVGSDITAEQQDNGDLDWSHGYTSRREHVLAVQEPLLPSV